MSENDRDIHKRLFEAGRGYHMFGWDDPVADPFAFMAGLAVALRHPEWAVAVLDREQLDDGGDDVNWREWPEFDAIVRAVPMTAVTEPEATP